MAATDIPSLLVDGPAPEPIVSPRGRRDLSRFPVGWLRGVKSSRPVRPRPTVQSRPQCLRGPNQPGARRHRRAPSSGIWASACIRAHPVDPIIRSRVGRVWSAGFGCR